MRAMIYCMSHILEFPLLEFPLIDHVLRVEAFETKSDFVRVSRSKESPQKLLLIPKSPSNIALFGGIFVFAKFSYCISYLSSCCEYLSRSARWLSVSRAMRLVD